MKEYRIEEVCTVKSSKRIYASDYVESGVPFFRGKEITEMSQNKSISDVLYISRSRFDEIDTKFGSPAIGDILMTAVGTLGSAWMVDKTPIYFKDGNLIWFSDFNTDLVNPHYLKALFESRWFQMLLLRRGTIGSVQSALTIEKVKGLVISLPSIDIQNNVIDEISKITDLYSLNFKIIKDLEEYSQLLFHKWFVDFNFPNENGGPYKNSGGEMVEVDGKMIPNGWEYEKITTLGKVVGGGTPPSDVGEYFTQCGIPWITPKDLSKNSDMYIERGERDISELGLKTSSAQLIPARSILMSSRAPIGYLAIAKNTVSTNQGFKSVVPTNPKASEFIFFSLKYKLKKLLMVASGSTFAEVSKEMVEKLKVVVPNEQLINKYYDSLESVFNKIELLLIEQKILKETRDLLIKKFIK